MQPIVKIGDTIAAAHITVSVALAVGDLNDRGQITFGSVNLSGGWSSALFQYSDGRFTPFLAAGQPALRGRWPQDVEFFQTGQMNQRGDVVFTAGSSADGFDGFGTYVWNYATQQVTAVALAGTHALNDLDFQGAGGPGAAINDYGEIAFNAWLRNGTGPVGAGVFLQRPGELPQPVLLPNEPPSGSRKVEPYPAWNSLDDTGRIAFEAIRDNDGGISGFVWEQGVIVPVALSGDSVPGGERIANVGQVLLNNQNPSVLVEASLSHDDRFSTLNLYRFTGGKLIPVAVQGQPMPGTAPYRDTLWASKANEWGQHALFVQLEDHQVALFLLDPNGTFHLVLKSGMATRLGTISEIVPNGLGLNSQGQVAVGVHFAGTAPDDETLVLLTPIAETAGSAQAGP
jgi:hypothetical protein